MRRKFMINNTAVPLENYIYSKHITGVSEVTLCYDIGNVKYMVIDGKYSDPVEYYTFSSEGEHEVYYCMNENTTSLYSFFQNSKISYADFDNFNSSFITDISYIFAACENLEHPNVSGLNTSNITKMEGCFAFSPKIKVLDLSTFDTSNVITMELMFRELGNNIEHLDLSSFDTSNVIKMSAMFETYSSSLKTIDLSSFNTPKVETMGAMFGSCYALERLDLSSFTFDANPSTQFMFGGCQALRYIKIMNDLKGTTFDTALIEDLPPDGIFECNKNFDYTEFTNYLPPTWTVNRV